MGARPLIHMDEGGEKLVFEPGSTLDLQGRTIGIMPTTDYFVDVGESDNNDGLSWQSAKASIGAAMTLAAALGTRGRARIFVAPGGYSEDVVTPLNTECPFGQLIAWNPTRRSFGAAWMQAATATEPTLKVRARGWSVWGFEIAGPASNGSILLDGQSANCNAAGFELHNSMVAGWGVGDFGIDIIGNGAPHSGLYNVHFNGIVGPAMKCSESGTDQPRFWEIDLCTFVDNTHHINMNPRGFKESVIKRSSFIQVGANRTANRQLDNRGGSNTIVGPHNVLSGTYDGAAGGYYESGSDDWAGNYNIAGLTAANPA